MSLTAARVGFIGVGPPVRARQAQGRGLLKEIRAVTLARQLQLVGIDGLGRSPRPPIRTIARKRSF